MIKFIEMADKLRDSALELRDYPRAAIWRGVVLTLNNCNDQPPARARASLRALAMELQGFAKQLDLATRLPGEDDEPQENHVQGAD